MQALGEEYTRQESKGTHSSWRAKLRKTIWSLRRGKGKGS